MNVISEFFSSHFPAPVANKKRTRTNSDDSITTVVKKMLYSDDVYRSSPYGTPRSAPLKSPPRTPTLLGPRPRFRQVSLTPSMEHQRSSPDAYCDAFPRRGLPTQKQVECPTAAAKTATPANVGTIRLNSIAEEPWEAKSMSNEEKWISRPNKRAFEIAAGATEPKKAIWKSVKEPESALRDMEIRDGIWQLVDLMQRFAEDYFNFSVKGKLSSSFFESLAPETAKVIGCVASGGPGGIKGWHDLFIEGEKREALVTAIIGNVLVEQVFQHIFFGGLPRHVKMMTELQRTHKDEDGFDRNKAYALKARGLLCNHLSTNTFNLPAYFANHVNRIVGTIYTHLKPILALNPTTPKREITIQALHTIVTHAGLLSLSMRIDPHTVYRIDPLCTEEPFASTRMECTNQTQMQQTNPQTPDDCKSLAEAEKQRRANLSVAEKKRAQNDDAVTQITILNGVSAYRVGGWETQDSTVRNVKYEREGYADKGVRVRKLTDGLVYCRWGRARRIKDGKSDGDDDVASHHGDAWKGGFREFSQVKGVVDWLGLERKGNGKGRGRAVEVVSEADLQAMLAAEMGE